jgi:hypothetical protein
MIEYTLNFTHENIELVHRYFSNLLTAEVLDGVTDFGSFMNLSVTRELTSEELAVINNLSPADIVEPSSQLPLEAVVKQSIINAINFGQNLIVEFATENVLMGITQAGKTKEVSDYLIDVMRYLQSGSLYGVINEVDRLLAEGVPSDLSPFITPNRLSQFKSRIVHYLQG